MSMKPEIKISNSFVEVIGHYDNDVLCAKLTLLADLYAIEHHTGYAKFHIKDLEKLKLVDSTLKFLPVVTISIYSNDGLTLLDSLRFTATAISEAQIISTGTESDSYSHSYVYTGQKEFLGFSASAFATSPDSGLGIGGYVTGGVSPNTLYIVESSSQVIANPSFLNIDVIDNSTYITLTIDNVSFNLSLQSLLAPILSLENAKADFVITSQNTGTEQYNIYINDTNISTFDQYYTFLHDGNTLTKCLGKQYYDGIITTPISLDNSSMTTLAAGLFSDCVASKIIISEGITTDNTALFDTSTETANIVYPSTITSLASLASYPYDIVIGQTGAIEYGWTTSLPASAFAFSKTITAATTFIFDIKSTIASIGNSAFNITTSGNYASTFNMYFRQPANQTITFGTTIISTGTQKATKTYNIYTDNESVKTAFEAYAASYTTINVYKLDGGGW